MQHFGIRHDTQRFMNIIIEARDAVKEANITNFDPAISQQSGNLKELAKFCREQSLTVIGKVSPYRELIKYSNFIDALVQAALIDRSDEEFNTYKLVFLKGIEEFLDALILKFGGTTSSGKAVLKSSYNTDTGGFAKAKGSTEDMEAQLFAIEQIFNKEIAEIEALKPSQSNTPVEIRGSVAIHNFFKNLELNHTLIRFGGIKYSNGSKSEITTPITVLHDQRLIMLKLKAQKFKFRKTPLSDNERETREKAIVAQIKQSNFKDTDYDMQSYVTGGLLLSKRFKGYVFIWTMPKDSFVKLKGIPGGQSNLMWS